MECKDCKNELERQTACYECLDGSNFKPAEATESPTPTGQAEFDLLRRKQFLEIKYEMADCDWMRAVVNDYTCASVVWLLEEVERLYKLDAS
ncbi:MAG: hypothetical protein KAR40_13790 [Candidatus Sabulitectum sp.]|nr:hypothetical protein [Candidatus Sabulitectum sp.]